MVYTPADVALKRKNKGLKLEPPGSSCRYYYDHGDGEVPGEGKTLEVVMNEARTVLTKEDVMDGVADLIPQSRSKPFSPMAVVWSRFMTRFSE